MTIFLIKNVIVMTKSVNIVQKKVWNMVYVKLVMIIIIKNIMKHLLIILLIVIKIQKDIISIPLNQNICHVILHVNLVIEQEINQIIIVLVVIQKTLIILIVIQIVLFIFILMMIIIIYV